MDEKVGSYTINSLASGVHGVYVNSSIVYEGSLVERSKEKARNKFM